jgi:oligopeptide/dipeptide ABC transporter ATP-binding protein
MLTTVSPRGPLLSARDIRQAYVVTSSAGSKRRLVRAVRGVSLDIAHGEIVGLVGETGSGKSTLARALMQLPAPSAGSVVYRDQDLTRLRGRRLQEARSTMQMIFQDPFGSLNPKWTVRSIIEEPLLTNRSLTRAERARRVADMLERVGLDPATHAQRRPHQLSGGQCQRVAIARALAVVPRLLVCDEPTSSLDVLIQKEVLALFRQLHAELNLAYLFISHDLALVAQLSHRVAVMHDGQLCEIGSGQALYERPAHPYTAELVECVRHPIASAHRPIDAQPAPGANRVNGHDPHAGCSFRSQCAFASHRCAIETPFLQPVSSGHSVACHHPLVRPDGKLARLHEIT